MVRKSSSQLYVLSSSSDTTTSSGNSDSALKKFNRLLRSSVARHWTYFKRNKQLLRVRGRSVSDAGLCCILDHVPELAYLDIPPRGVLGTRSTSALDKYHLHAPTFSITSAGGGSHIGLDEASDGSDVERPRRNHLRVPTPAFVGQSTGNFAAGSAGGGREVPRSAPATPLQLEPTTPRSKHDKQAIKPLSGSAVSVRANGTGDAAEGKQPSKSRQKKFQRHFPQVGPEEKVLNYYSCALVGDLLLQGHLYITKNYFAFYSNVFGYVTKLLIPTTSVLRITKEKVARIIPNAVGVCTRDERHVFGSLLSRDSTYKLMTHVWKAARAPPELIPPNIKSQDLRASEVELDASEYSPEDDSSSAGDRLDAPDPPATRTQTDTLIGTGKVGVSAVIQPALLTGSTPPPLKQTSTPYNALLISFGVLLALSASWMCYKLYHTSHHPLQEDLSKLSGSELYSELVRFRARLHGRAANELHTFLTSNLLLLTKVRQSLEALSGVILSDMAHEVPADTVFS